MLVFWSEKLVFLAVPKTGTTALEGALASRASMVMRDPPHLKHAPVYRYRRFLHPYFKQAGGEVMETLAVVRNPVDWLGSWYRYRNRDELVGHQNSTRDVSFDDFVQEYMKGKSAPFALVGSQAKFLLDGDGNVGVTHLFQYEQQDKLIAYLQERLGTAITLPQLNVSPRMPLELSEENRAKLHRKCADEFRVWEAGAR
ncbi:MAG: gamma-glutamyl kinase [Octadecabacter sp.]|jgi:hypothetical protein